jgi:hypothetical protein
MSSRPIDIHIEELVLHGFAPEDRDRIGEAVRLELVRLLTERGMPPNVKRDGEIRLAGGPLVVEADSQTELCGTRFARHIYEGLSQ